MTGPMGEPMPHPSDSETGLAIICGGGSLPFALADAAMRRGRRVVLFALRGLADPERVGAYRHHWTWMGQFGRFIRIAAEEGCRDVIFIGAVVRPALWRIRPDLRVLRLMPELFRLYRGGDDQLLSGIGRQFERHGFRLLGPRDIAPELTMPVGALGTGLPTERDRADIERGFALLAATSPFDVGQAAIVADRQILAIEGPEGTDHALARVAELRRGGRVRSGGRRGVLVKAAKRGQDERLDLPVIGPSTVEAVAAAGLAGIAVAAGSTLVAEPGRIAAAADGAGIFVVGVDVDRLGR